MHLEPVNIDFPVIPAGNYRIVVTPPGAWSAPSSVAISALQGLPGAPYALAPASFGNAFAHAGPLSVDFDVPVDPREGALFMRKSTMTTIAAPGDFVRYELSVENTASSGIASNVRIVDQLPTGVRFVPGSAMRDSNGSPDPVIGPDLRTLEFTIGDLNAGERVAITYVVEIIGGKRNQDLVNSATAYGDAGLVSNGSDARIRLTEDLFRSTSTIIGRVVEGHCSATTFAEDMGVSGIRIYLEDGQFAVSDESGRFHFEGLQPGTHVAQLDPDTVPNYFEIIGCDTAPQFSGRTDSQFVKTSRGSLTRADFYMRRKLPPEGIVDIEIKEPRYRQHGRSRVRRHGQWSGQHPHPEFSTSWCCCPTESATRREHCQPTAKLSVNRESSGQPLLSICRNNSESGRREIRFEAQISANIHGELSTKAFAQFDSPIEAGQKTPIVETRMIREKAVIENEGYVLNLKFGVLSAELSPADRLELDTLIAGWEGVSDIRYCSDWSQRQPEDFTGEPSRVCGQLCVVTCACNGGSQLSRQRTERQRRQDHCSGSRPRRSGGEQRDGRGTPGEPSGRVDPVRQTTDETVIP